MLPKKTTVVKQPDTGSGRGDSPGGLDTIDNAAALSAAFQGWQPGLCASVALIECSTGASRPAEAAQPRRPGNPIVDGTQDLPDDVALLERIVARDACAVSVLYDRHARLLFNLILRILRDRADAEDVLQEVFVAVWTRAESYQPTLGPPAAWLVRIARNRAIDRFRSNAARGRLADASQHLPAAAAAPAAPEDRHDVVRALDVLPPDQRELVEQAYFMGRTHSELAAHFGLPLGTVKTRVRNGLLALRAHFQQMVVER